MAAGGTRPQAPLHRPPEHLVLREAALAFDLKNLDPQFLLDPYPFYDALRQHDPIHLMPDDTYLITRYDDCAAIYRDPEGWSSDKKLEFRPLVEDSLLYEHHTTSLVFNDPPYHTRVRKLLAPAFTPRALKTLQPRVEGLVDRLLDVAAAQGSIDLIDDFAAAVPVQLIGDMLGIPGGERGPLREWSRAILGALEPVLSAQQYARGIEAVAEFKAYLLDLIDRACTRRLASEPGEILSTLIASSQFALPAHATQEQLSAVELLHNCIFLLNAGHETTTNLIGNSVDLLIRHGQAMDELRADPAIIDTAVEEFLRMESSNQLGNRRAIRDTMLGRRSMPAGSYVHIAIGAANRDPAQFPDPGVLNLRRHPNRHLAFATGIHTCAGMSLARMEAQVAIAKLVRRFRVIEPDGNAVRTGRARFRGFLHYPVRLR
jgi:cytochrome P450